jgi:pimeloyl-ACP methyl ester carboxylesterase
VHLKTASGGGGGAAFATFLMNDVRPFIESRYPVDPAKSVLVGHSAGGSFTAMVLLQKPESFAGYVIGGLPVSMMGASLLDDAKNVATRGDNRRVFIGYSPPDAARIKADTFAAPLSARGSTFKVKQMEFEDDDHNTSYVELIARGIPFVLPADGSDKTAIQLDAAVLDRYVGTYRASEQLSFTITRKGDQLFGAATNGPPTELFAESENAFFARGVNAQAVFKVEGGKVVSAYVSVNNREMLARRVA